MPRGAARTDDANKKIEAVILELHAKPNYSDQEAAKIILERHHIDISTLGVRIYRTKKLRLLQRNRTPKQSGDPHIIPNFDTVEGLHQFIEQRVNLAAEKMEEALKEMSAGFDALQTAIEKLKLRPLLSPDEAAALNVLRRRRP